MTLQLNLSTSSLFALFLSLTASLHVSIKASAAPDTGAARAAGSQKAEVARIDKRVITLEEFNQKYQENLKYFQFRIPTKKGVLDDLVKRELGILEARKMGLDKDPAVIERMNTVLYHSLLDRKLGPEIEKLFVSDEEAQAYYSKNPEIRISHIFLSVKPDASASEVAETKQKLQNILALHLLKEKRSFAEVAQSFSEGPAAAVGGDLDYQSKESMAPELYDAALKLKMDEFTREPVRTRFGWHLVRLTGKKTWSDLIDKAGVKKLALEQKRNQLFENYMNQLKKAYQVKTNEVLISQQ